TGNTFALNDVALRFHSSEEGISFVANDFQQNVTLAEVEGGGTAMKTGLSGNFYSEYAGYDLDGDARGDVAFEEKMLAGELSDAHPSRRLFRGPFAMELLGAVAEISPVSARHLLLRDPAPAMAPRAALGAKPL